MGFRFRVFSGFGFMVLGLIGMKVLHAPFLGAWRRNALEICAVLQAPLRSTLCKPVCIWREQLIPSRYNTSQQNAINDSKKASLDPGRVWDLIIGISVLTLSPKPLNPKPLDRRVVRVSKACWRVLGPRGSGVQLEGSRL